MSYQTFAAFLIFALATSITPGPNNIMLMASGVNYGFRATLPHIFGASIGFGLLLLSAGLGLNRVFSSFPAIYTVMKWLGAAYFIYFAWKIAAAPIKPLQPASDVAGPRGAWRFRDAFAFQFVNPKSWIMAAGAFSSYVPSMSSASLTALAALVFAMIALPCFLLWVTFGSRMRRYLEQGNRRRIFNLSMAALLLASLLPILLESGVHFIPCSSHAGMPMFISVCGGCWNRLFALPCLTVG